MGDAGTSKTLVLLEDDSLQMQVLSLQLRAEGLAPLCCGTGDEALQQIAAAAPGELTLLMDVQVAHVQPVEFCRQVRALFPAARIVGCSASRPAERVLAAFDDFCLKPVAGRALADAAFPKDAKAGGPVAELNVDTFENLARSMSPAMLRSLFAAYFKDAEQRLSGMDAAYATADVAAVKRYAHTLKGSSGMLGVQAVAQAAFALETLDAPAQAPLLLAALRRRLAHARDAIHAKLDTLSAEVAMVPSTTDSPTALLQESKDTP